MINELLLQQQYENAWSAAQAQKQMDFQERLSNSAHQREVADLKAAGLNPVLSAGGNGAGTPTGSNAEISSIIPQMIDAMSMNAKSMSQIAERLTETSSNVTKDALGAVAGVTLGLNQMMDSNGRIAAKQELEEAGRGARLSYNPITGRLSLGGSLSNLVRFGKALYKMAGDNSAASVARERQYWKEQEEKGIKHLKYLSDVYKNTDRGFTW